MRHALNIFTFIVFAFAGNAGFAEELSCKNYGEIEFFKKATPEIVDNCIETIDENAHFNIFDNGNNVPMNAVQANVDSRTLAKVLSVYNEEALPEILNHRNFEELSIAHLASVVDNGAALLIELVGWNVDINILKDKKEGSLIKSDRGITALHYALSTRPVFNNILALLAMGVSTDTKDKTGNIAFNYAISNQLDYDILNLILVYTEDLEKNDKGYNALHFAVQKIVDVEKLNLVFAMTNIKDHKELTENEESVLHLAAAAATSPDLFEVVYLYSSDFLCEVDKKGAKAIDYARKNPNISQSKIVLELQNQCN